MAIFQKSVVENFLSKLEDSVIDSAYSKFKEVYSASRINEIKTLKEEQYQEGFVRDIFAKVLGYTLQPESNYNIELEKKNETDSKKADGAILKDGNVIGVIELKDNKTKSLDKVKDQAFGYKVNHKGCKYVITSNFQKLRLYVDDATEYEEFDLYSLDREEFARFYLFLSKEGLLDKDTADKLKEKTKFHEEDITKKLYKDYSSFKHKFFSNAVKNNPQYDKLILFKKSQKFLDRILFILFSEDKRLIPENAISRIVDSWHKADDLQYKPLYELFKILFTHLNKGHKYKSGYEIPAYNGGLFIADEILDNISIDDDVLQDDLLILSKYDFNTEVDVNILGHIFEHSLTELEEIEAEIKGEVADNQKSKRKKDGVFYTPKYITKYIVENTIGKLCNKKKEELRIEDFDVSEYQNKNGKVNAKGKQLFNVLEDYKKWLFELRILDPACGSGAFLNQALSFLIKEHKFIDDLIAELTNTPLRLFDTDKAILEKNIFGVDINDESVEIAKLSLWLRTAQKGRKLSNLSNNIKCGNSLIDEVEVALEKAFDWQKEFPEVFANGGFDVVIGNPPYVPTEFINDDDKKYLELNYQSAFGRINLYPIFYEKGIILLRTGGQLSFITPYTILKNQYYIEARKYILTNTSINELIDFKGIAVFEDAAVDSIILSLTKYPNTKNKYSYIFNIKDFQSNQFQNTQVTQEDILKSDDVSFNVSINDKMIKRISKSCKTMAEIINFNQGIITGSNKKFVTSEKNEFSVKVLTGSDFNRYLMKPSSNFVTYDTSKLHRPRKRQIFEVDEKIILRQTGAYPICSIDFERFYTLDTVHNGLLIDKKFNIKYILTLLNSKLLRFLYENSINESGKVFAQVKIIYIDPLPIKNIRLEEQVIFAEKADIMLKINKDYSSIISKFIKYLNSQFNIEKLPKKLQNWDELEFGSFIKELNKVVKSKGEKLSKMEEMDWMDVFETKKNEAQNLKAEINKTDTEINQMVYKLYDLTEEEIKIVEES